MATVAIAGVEKWFGHTPVIRGIDVTIAAGEFCVLVGPSGCGKSTLLRMIAGLEAVDSGNIAISGRIINGIPPKDRNIAMVFQNYALYPHMSVRDNMSFSLRLAKRSASDIDVQLKRASDILRLDDYLHRFPRELSGGQRQRVAMGRAIVRSPQVFLFDEPLSNLDAKLRVRMRTKIREIHQNLGTTSIYVTHDQIEAMTMADRIVVMKDGLVEQIGTPLELYDQPSNTFVASFIGSPAMNLLRGVVRRRNGSIQAEFGDGGSLPLPDGLSADDMQPILYGIRPEHWHLTETEGLPVRVAVVEPTGAEIHLSCHFGADEIVATTRDRGGFRPGDLVHLLPRADSAHFFNPADGKRIDVHRRH